MTVLDGMHYLQQAWNNVTETTIANCYRKAGFKTIDDTETTDDIETEIEDDPLDDLPLSRLVGANFTLSDYVSVDDDLPTCETLTDEAIVDDIIAARDVMPEDDDDDDDMTGDHDIVPVEPPTVDLALKACSTLRLFLQQQTDVTDILEKLCAIDKCVTQIDLSKRCAKQSMITDFFRM